HLASVRPQFDIHLFESLPSTNTQLWKMLDAGAPSGSVVIAQQQTAGRGQRNRKWCSPPGGLYLSLALEPDLPVSYSAQLTCMGAWGIAIALNNLGATVDIKWPNDLYFRGKKLGGILTETKLSTSSSSKKGTEKKRAKIKQAVIGVGINWHNPVPETGIALTSILSDPSSSLDENKINCLEMLIAVVLRGILQGYIFQQQVGSQVFMKAYQKLLTQVGSTVSLDSNGALSLATPILNPSPKSHCQNQQLQNQQPLNALDTDELVEGSAVKMHPAQRQHQVRLSENSNCSVKQWANRSGEVIGISEEGYLQVALHPLACNKASKQSYGHTSANPPAADQTATDILLFRPSEIHIS
ncbi:MAG: biotin--[acetyl-CoA-carboxylase] ligase, partial [Cyanobacteria bacterium J06632_3]